MLGYLRALAADRRYTWTLRYRPPGPLYTVSFRRRTEAARTRAVGPRRGAGRVRTRGSCPGRDGGRRYDGRGSRELRPGAGHVFPEREQRPEVPVLPRGRRPLRSDRKSVV